MKQIKKIITFTLCLTLVISTLLSISVFASENTDDDYIVKYHANEITDVENLIFLARQNNVDTQLSAISPLSLKAEDETLEYKQLLEVREYSDGTIQKDYSKTTITLAANSSQYNSSSSDTMNEYGYVVTLSMYYTVKLTDTGSSLGLVNATYKLSKITTRIVKSDGNKITVTKGSHSYVLSEKATKSASFTFNNNSTAVQQTFTLNSAHTGFYTTETDSLAAKHGICADSYVTLSNKKTIHAEAYINPDDLEH